MSIPLMAVVVAGAAVVFVDICKHLVARRAPRERSTCYEIARWVPNSIKAVVAATKLVFDPRPNFGSFGSLVDVTFHSEPIIEPTTATELVNAIEAINNATRFPDALDELDELDRSTEKIPMNIQYDKVVAHITPAAVNTDNVTAVELESLGEDYAPLYNVYFPGTVFHFNPGFAVDKVIEATVRVVYITEDGEGDGYEEEEKEEEEEEGQETSGETDPPTLDIEVTDTVRPWSRGIAEHGLQRLAPFILRDIKMLYPEFDEVLAYNEIICLELRIGFASLNKEVYSI